MADVLTPEERSAVMSRVKGKDTKPEMTVRRLIHGMGYRYRLHRRDLPGTPDLTFASRRKVIFVHGCFWHRHDGCPLARMPKSRLDFWRPKLEGNKKRDERNIQELRSAGWQVLVIWECQLKDMGELEKMIRSFLDGSAIKDAERH
jgi:DNA mismatch endonuclease (patch repair protein)